MNWADVAKVEDLRPGTSLCAELDGKVGVALFNVEGQIFALENTCPHAGGPLGEGILHGEVVTCPWHGWKFNVRTGLRLKNPAQEWAVPRYPVRIQSDVIQVGLTALSSDHEMTPKGFQEPSAEVEARERA